MSTDTHRVTTCSKNTSQHPGLLIPKQTHRTTQEVTADRREKEDAKKRKEMKYKTDMERVANFEKNQAQNDANEHTLRVQTARPLVRTRSYADVLRQGSGSDVEMKDATVTTEQPSPFEYAEIEPGNTTDDGMQTAVQDLPKKKYVSFFFLSYFSAHTTKTKGKEKLTRVRDAIKAQNVPAKNLKRKSIVVESSDSGLNNPVTPRKTLKKKSKAPTESDNLQAPPKRVVKTGDLQAPLSVR